MGDIITSIFAGALIGKIIYLLIIVLVIVAIIETAIYTAKAQKEAKAHYLKIEQELQNIKEEIIRSNGGNPRN